MSFDPNGTGGISEASDVALSNPLDSQLLTYDGTTAKWENKDPAVTAADLNGKVDTGSLVLNVRDYGALGDGTTDDTAAIQTAYDAASPVGATVLWPASATPYIVSGRLDVNGTTTTGYGATVQVKAGVTQTWNVFQPSVSKPTAILGLSIDLNSANTTDPGVSTQGVGVYAYSATAAPWAGLVLRDVSILNGHQIGLRITTGVSVTNPATDAPSTPVDVTNVTVTGCQWGIWMSMTGDVKLSGCRVSDNGTGGIYDYLSAGTQIIGCTANNNNGHGIVSQYGYQTRVTGCTANGNAEGGIVFGGGSTTLPAGSRYTITGCTVSGSGESGIILDPTISGSSDAVPVFATVTGNVCTGNTQHGIVLTRPQYVSVVGNTCDSNTLSGISIQTDNATATGNTLINNDVGLSFYGTLGGHVAADNTAIGNVSDQYRWGPTTPNAPIAYSGTGVPDLDASIGSTYRRWDGGTGSTFYVKEATGTTGWVAK